MELSGKPTILHLTTSMDTGGTERQLLLTIPRLHDFNHAIICLKKWGAIGDQLKTLGFPVYFVPTPHLFSLRAIGHCKMIIQHHKPKLTITYLPFADLFGRIWRYYWHIPILVCSLRSTMREWRYFPLVLLNIATQYMADHFLAVSNTVKIFYEKWGLFKNHTNVIYNGVALREILYERSTDLPVLPKDTAILGYVAKLRKERGHELLFQAMARLKAQGVSAQLWLAGDGHYQTALGQRVLTLGIADCVTFLGHKRDIPALLDSLTVYIHPSQYEGMSNALLEAMAAGCPIITTDIPENRELIQNRVHGLLIPPKNPEALAEAIQFALKNQKIMRQLGNKARQRTQEIFNIDHTVAHLTQLLQKYVDEK